jgi:hypothetical protein
MRFKALRLRFLVLLLSLFGIFSCQESNKIVQEYAHQNEELGSTLAQADSPDVIQDADNYDCPDEGNAKSDRLKQLNVLKNRTQLDYGKAYDASISMASLLQGGDDTHRWNTNTYVKLKAYVQDVKVGGVETVNCKAKEKDLRDTHIDLTLDPMSFDKRKVVIAEITPRLRKIMAKQGLDWRTASVRDKYLGRWVEIEGWLFFDSEHANMAENTRPGNEKNWRATAWEIHPVTSIKVSGKY